jgi:hypothetical protein
MEEKNQYSDEKLLEFKEMIKSETKKSQSLFRRFAVICNSLRKQ